MTKEIVRSGLRLGRELNDELKKAADKISMTKNQLMVKILYDWVQSQDKNRSA